MVSLKKGQNISCKKTEYMSICNRNGSRIEQRIGDVTIKQVKCKSQGRYLIEKRK